MHGFAEHVSCCLDAMDEGDRNDFATASSKAAGATQERYDCNNGNASRLRANTFKTGGSRLEKRGKQSTDTVTTPADKSATATPATSESTSPPKEQPPPAKPQRIRAREARQAGAATVPPSISAMSSGSADSKEAEPAAAAAAAASKPANSLCGRSKLSASGKGWRLGGARSADPYVAGHQHAHGRASLRNDVIGEFEKGNR